MKIRIKGNSIRIRLSRSEVNSFGKDGYLEERTEFGANAFIYVLQRSDDSPTLSASFANDTITVFVPNSITHEWTNTDIIGYDHNMDIGNGNQLFLLIEKDFKCIDGPAYEDQSDNYEHPTKVC